MNIRDLNQPHHNLTQCSIKPIEPFFKYSGMQTEPIGSVKITQKNKKSHYFWQRSRWMCSETVEPTLYWVLWGTGTRSVPHKMHRTVQGQLNRHRGLRISVQVDKVYYRAMLSQAINLQQKKNVALNFLNFQQFF